MPPKTRREDASRYAKPAGTEGRMRWTAEEQRTLQQLAGTIKAGTEALHRSLAPELDQGGRAFTAAMRRALISASRAGALPGPHPARQVAPRPIPQGLLWLMGPLWGPSEDLARAAVKLAEAPAVRDALRSGNDAAIEWVALEVTGLQLRAERVRFLVREVLQQLGAGAAA